MSEFHMEVITEASDCLYLFLEFFLCFMYQLWSLLLLLTIFLTAQQRICFSKGYGLTKQVLVIHCSANMLCITLVSRLCAVWRMYRGYYSALHGELYHGLYSRRT
jgi:hypothetical protein